MRNKIKVAGAFLIGLVVSSSVTWAQLGGRGRNVQFVNGTAISPSSVTTSNVNTTTLNVGTTSSTGIRLHALNEVTSYTPTDFTSAHSVFGRNAVTGASSGGVWLTYHTTDNEAVVGALSPGSAWRPLSFPASAWKFRPNGLAAIADITNTGAFNSSATSGNQAFTCTNVGCRLSLGNTGRYLYDDGTRLNASGEIAATNMLAINFYTGAASTKLYGTSFARAGAVADRAAGDLLFAVNDGSDVLTVDGIGMLRVNAINAAKPTCNATNRGRVFYLDGAAGVADTYEICMKNAADAYAWKTIVTP